MHYVVFGISIAFISWMVGMIVNGLLKNTSYYEQVTDLNFIQSEHLDKMIGLGLFKWIVKNTFFKYFNQKLTLKNKIELSELRELRKEMTYSEISHLIGFAFVTVFAIYKGITIDYVFGLTIMLCNILLNLYPALLQQKNKRRINRLLSIVESNLN